MWAFYNGSGNSMHLRDFTRIIRKKRDATTLSRTYLKGFLVLFLSLCLTLIGSYYVRLGIEKEVRNRLEFDTHKILHTIDGRLQAHKQVLLGGAAMLDASKEVTRKEWFRYVQRIQIDRHFKSILGLGLSLWIPPSQLTRHMETVRQEGFRDYHVWPQGVRDGYSAIVFLEPFDNRNQRAFGYDMYSEPIRRQAMEQSRDENTVSLSGRVTLVQESGKEVQAGTLMYIPIYKKNMPLETTTQRRQAIMGWVYSPIRMGDFLSQSLEGWDNKEKQHLHLQVYDGTEMKPEALLYRDENVSVKGKPDTVLFSLDRRSDFNGRIWTYHFELVKGESSGLDYGKFWLTLVFGISISGLLYFLTVSYLNTRVDALGLAEALTSEIRNRTEEINNFFNSAIDLLCVVDSQGRFLRLNPEWEKTFGYTLDELNNRRATDIVHPDDIDSTEKALGDLNNEKAVMHFINRNRHKDGSYKTIEWRAFPYKKLIYGSGRDITDRIKTETALRESEERFRRLAENAADLIYRYEYAPQKRFSYVSPVSTGMTGYTPQEYYDDPDLGYKQVHPGDVTLFQEISKGNMEKGRPVILRWITKDGKIIWVEQRVVFLYDDKGELVAMEGVARDVSRRIKAEKQLLENQDRFRQLADYDTLTSLPNRRLLTDRLAQALAAAKRNGHFGALIFLDLDNFKPLNDVHGHGAGDLLLIEVARRITSCVREVDTVARFGGDEFLVMVRQLDTGRADSENMAGIVAEKIRRELARPYLLKVPGEEGSKSIIEHHCSASLGIVLFDGQSGNGDEVIKQADKAMYKSKEAGRNTISFYNPYSDVFAGDRKSPGPLPSGKT